MPEIDRSPQRAGRVVRPAFTGLAPVAVLLLVALAGGVACGAGSGSAAAGGSAAAPSTTAPDSGAPAPATGLSPTTSPGSGGAGGATASPTPQRSGGPVLVQLTARDAGKAVALRVGDRLEVILGGTRLTGLWTLSGYPRALRPDLRQASFGRFVFVAVAPGSGPVTFVRSDCGSYGRPCLDRPEPVDPTATAPSPARTFTIQVRVA